MIAAPAGATAPTLRAGSASRSRRRTRCATSRRSGPGATSASAELDLLDEAALRSPTPRRFTDDMLLSMALWKAVADRYDLLRGDLGLRAGRRSRAASASPPWSGAGSTPPRPRGRRRRRRRAGSAARSRCRCPRPAGCPTPWRRRCVRGCRLDPSEADVTARLRSLRAPVERVRDLVDREPAPTHAPQRAPMLDRLDARVADVAGQGPARRRRRRPARAARARRRPRRARPHRRRVQPPRRRPRRGAGPRPAHRARGARRRAARPGRAVRGRRSTPAPRFAVPDVAALGAVPHEPAAVDAYLVRLDAVGRAMTLAQDAYAGALAERDELAAGWRRTPPRPPTGSPSRTTAAAHRQPTSPSATTAARDAARGPCDLADLVRRTARRCSTTPSPTWPAPGSCSTAYQAYLRQRPAAPPDREGPHEHDRLACTQPGCTGTSWTATATSAAAPGRSPPPLPPLRHAAGAARPRPRPDARDRRRDVGRRGRRRALDGRRAPSNRLGVHRPRLGPGGRAPAAAGSPGGSAPRRPGCAAPASAPA